MKALKMQHADDPAQEITTRTHDLLDQIQLVNPYEVLVGIYQRPNKTASGIMLPDKYRDEDIYQGKVGLVLKLGELAFKPDEKHQWPSRVPKVGDWIAFRVTDSWQLILGGQQCRVVEDRFFRLIVDDPDLVY